jgi:glycosyltransferase involved in cell wall biosynthesis
LKIAVYTIALNEEKHVPRWYDSIKDADYIVVADTGSSDDTVGKLKSLGGENRPIVNVYSISVQPFRFDDARNAALALVPGDADVCISLDMDEWLELGWRKHIEDSWVPGTTRLNYRYAFDYHPGQVNSYFWIDKIHARHGYRWQRPVHETIFPQDIKEVSATSANLLMNQIQDRTKSTRKNYLPLLEKTYNEYPIDSQIAFWYGRELLNYGKIDEGKAILQKYLELPTSTWNIERSEALRLLGGINNLYQALIETDTRREIWLDLAIYFYNKNDWINCVWACENGLSKSARTGTYLDNESTWHGQLNDYASIGYFSLGEYVKAKFHNDIAIKLAPNDQRLLNNARFIEEKLNGV